MGRWTQHFRDIGRTLYPRHQRGLEVLGILSIVMLVGVAVTGVWQFFAHEPDPNLFNYVPGTNAAAERSQATTAAQIHDAFATGTGIVALVGGAWFAYRVSHRVPVAAVVVVVFTFFTALTVGVIRYNLIKIQGQSFDEVGSGYTQVFTSDVEYVVTDSGEIRPGVFRVAILAHIATVPLLVGFGWWSIRRAIERRTSEIQNEPKRTWFNDLQQP